MNKRANKHKVTLLAFYFSYFLEEAKELRAQINYFNKAKD